jgi:hypothetical protein
VQLLNRILHVSFWLIIGLSSRSTLLAAPIPQQTIPCPSSPDTYRLSMQAPSREQCEIIRFDRLKNTINGRSPETAYSDLAERQDIVEAIKSSKVLISGSVLRIHLAGHTPEDCQGSDWKIIAQPEESPNVVIYGASDVGAGSCGKSGENGRDATFFIALPITVLWAEVTPYIARERDPMHKGPTKAPSAPSSTEIKDCNGKPDPTSSTILPCDRDEWPVKWLYDTAWLFYNPLTQPGSAQGTISLSPVIGGGNQKLSYDLQLNPALHVPGGWLALPVTFEKDSNTKANLDSLIAGLSYEIRFVKVPDMKTWGGANCRKLPAATTDKCSNPTRSADHFTIRKPQIQLRIGPEFAPTRPRDLNMVGAATVRIPFITDFHRQPSSISVFPVLGIENGQSIVTHLPVSDTRLRGVAGVDASFRWPFDITHNFLGDKPMTIDYSYRMRWLANSEPMTDIASGGPETVSTGRHSYWRGSLNAPLSSNFQFKLTVQHGALPPDFKILDYSLSLGLTFTNPGSTEH